MKASFSEVKRMVTPCVHGACLDRDYINEQDLSKITTLLKPYCNVKVNIEKSKYDDGYLEFVIRVDALGVAGCFDMRSVLAEERKNTMTRSRGSMK